MDPTISVSKGCFAFKTSGKKRKKSLKSTATIDELWYKEYEKFNKSAMQKQKDFYRSVYGKFIEEIVDFVKNSGEMLLTSSPYLVPAAMMLPGMALADHTQIFSILISKIKEDVTNWVALLKGKDCPSIKVAVESVVRQFTTIQQSNARRTWKNNGQVEDESDFESSDDDGVVFVSELKKSNLNFPSLSQWYSSLGKNETNERKRKSTSDAHRKPLVIVVSDVEGSFPNVLQDLIYISKNYLKSLPIVFVFSIATAPSLLGRYIPEHALSSLSMKFIHSPSPFTILPDMINELGISRDSLFQLGGKTLKILVDTFLFLDNSFAGFMRMYQVCLMEHFYAKPVNALCCPLNDLKTVIKNLSASDLEAIRQLPSFRKYVESKPPKERAPLLLDDAHLKKVVFQLMTDLHARIWEFHTGVKVLNTITSHLPGSPFGQQLYETYIRASTKDISSTPELEEALKLLKFTSQEEFLKRFEAVNKIFEESVEHCPGSGSVIKEFVSNMKKGLDKIADGEQENDEALLSSPQTPRKRKPSGRVLKDSPAKNTCSPTDKGKLKGTPPQSPAKNTKSHKLREIRAEPSTPICSPKKSSSTTPVSGLRHSPAKRKCVQSPNGVSKNSTPPQSPLKNVSGSPVTESPGRRSRGQLLKTPKDNTPKNPQCTPKDASKETLVDLGLSGGKMDRNQLRERLLQLSRQKKESFAKEELKWEALKEEVLENLKKALTLCLGQGSPPLSSFPLYEVVVFEDVAAVKNHLIPPSPQAALHSALVNPKQYLECDCCELADHSSILPSLPDVCIVYKLHLECGRMINLYDWLQAFSMIVNSNSDEGKEVQVDVNLHARFMHAVAELQFMGFVKATKRKTDHVLRLTWGGLSS